MQKAVTRIWQWLSKDFFLLGLLTGLLALLLLTFLLPQSPFSSQETADFTRWLAEVRSIWGQWVKPLAALGLLTIRRSWPQRLLLALLALAITVRSVELVEQWVKLPRWQRVRQGAICGGGALLIAGWLLQLGAGWIEPEVSAWPDEVLAVPAHNLQLPAPGAGVAFARRGYGLYLLREREGIGLEVQAVDAAGVPLELLASAHGMPQERLELALTERTSDAYFALPDAGVIFRASMLHPPPHTEFRVQIYGETESELLTETLFQGSGTLFTTNVHLEIVSTPFPQLTVIYNPGAPLTVLGWLALAVAGGGWLAGRQGWWPASNQQQDDETVLV
ncbi:MAG: hypothetical protein U9Q70_08545 [Chloroflexota bacterium]|nr:hypothetical protein [Chloroflexota bacterium]